MCGKTVLVSGGSAGLGAHIVRAFASRGYNVAINYAHNSSRAESLKESVEAEFRGIGVVVLQGDVSKSVDCERVVRETVKKFGQLDVLVSNAGWSDVVPLDDLDALDDEYWDKCLGINIKSHFYLFRAALPHLKLAKGSTVITGSLGAFRQRGSSLPYITAKCGLNHMAKCLAKTYAPDVRVNVICPGLLLTEWSEKWGSDVLEKIKEGTPMKKEVDMLECAQLFITISENSSMTGAVINIDGGLSLN